MDEIQDSIEEEQEVMLEEGGDPWFRTADMAGRTVALSQYLEDFIEARNPQNPFELEVQADLVKELALAILVEMDY